MSAIPSQPPVAAAVGVTMPPPLSANMVVIHIRGTIVQVFPSGPSPDGLHMHFQVRIDQDLNGKNPAPVGDTVFCAVRFGDFMGLPGQIPGLQSNVPIEMQGEYITNPYAAQYNSNPSLNVLHFTHHPVGFVVYQGVRYS